MDVKPPCESSHSLRMDAAVSETRSDKAEHPTAEKGSPETTIQDSNRGTMDNQAEKLLSISQKRQPGLSLYEQLEEKRKELEQKIVLMRASVLACHRIGRLISGIT